MPIYYQYVTHKTIFNGNISNFFFILSYHETKMHGESFLLLFTVLYLSYFSNKVPPPKKKKKKNSFRNT